RPNKSENLRLTWQVSPKNKFALYGDVGQRCVCHISLSATRTPEAAQHWVGEPNALFQASWISTISNKLLLEAGLSVHPEKISHQREPGITPDTYAAVELSTGINFRASSTYVTFPATVTAGKLTASYVTGTHAFKGGLQTQNGCRTALTYA